MTLDRLGRHTLHEQRYAGPRAISRFEGDSRPDDASFQVVDSVESASTKPDRGETSAATARSGPTPAAAPGKGEDFKDRSTTRPLVDIEKTFTRVPGPKVETPVLPPMPEGTETVGTILQRDFLETRTEFVNLHDLKASSRELDPVDGTGDATDLETADTGVLSREMESVEARLARLESPPVVRDSASPSADVPALSVVPAAPVMPSAGPPKPAEHHVEVLIDSIIVNTVSPGDTNKKTPSRRDPADGLALFQQRRKR